MPDLQRTTKWDRSIVGRAIAVAAAMVLTASTHAAPTVGTTVLATSGQAAPSGAGSFAGFSTPVLNDVGQTAFAATLGGIGVTSLNDSGIFRSASGTTTTIARAGAAAPDGVLFAGPLGNPALNNAGQAVFSAHLSGTGVTSTNDNGIYRGDGLTTATLARTGQNAPGGGVYSGFGAAALNNAGQAAFFAFLDLTPSTTNGGIYRTDATATVQIARKGQASPGGTVNIVDFYGGPSLNELGQSAFSVAITGNQRAILRGDGVTTVAVAQQGQGAPGGSSFSSYFGVPASNDGGQLAFGSEIVANGATGIYRGSGSGDVVQIVRTGQLAPNGVGTFSNVIVNDPILNNAGQVAFRGLLSNSTSGIFRGDAIKPLVQVARGGQVAPGGGTFGEFDSPALNGSGQLAFSAYLTGSGLTAANNRGLYFYDDKLGLRLVARDGDALLGSTITSLSFADGSTFGDERSGLNAFGQVAYSYTLANGASGVAVYFIPEPATLVMISAVLTAATRRRRFPLRVG